MRNFMAAAAKKQSNAETLSWRRRSLKLFFAELSTTIQFHSGHFSSGVVCPSSPNFALDDLVRLI